MLWYVIYLSNLRSLQLPGHILGEKFGKDIILEASRFECLDIAVDDIDDDDDVKIDFS